MTELELREQYVHAIGEYYGATEGDARHRELIDWYNRLDPLPRGYKMTYSADWCVATAVAIAVKLGLTDIIFPECSCAKEKAMYQAAGRWTGDKNYVPRTGDFLLLDHQTDGRADHWATVVRVTGSTIRTIEGNLGNRVGHRDIEIGDPRIHGYCLPDYASRADKPGFRDVPTDAWYAEAVAYCVEHGLMAGISETVFGVGQKVTREQLALVLMKLHMKFSK